LSWWRKQDEEDRPFIVGLTWVTKSKEKLERLDEGLFKVDVGGEDVFQKVRWTILDSKHKLTVWPEEKVDGT
jgi:hypothetical protein